MQLLGQNKKQLIKAWRRNGGEHFKDFGWWRGSRGRRYGREQGGWQGRGRGGKGKTGGNIYIINKLFFYLLFYLLFLIVTNFSHSYLIHCVYFFHQTDQSEILIFLHDCRDNF